MTNSVSAQESNRLRRSALVNLTLTDLFVVVLFVLLFFTFRATDEGKVEIDANNNVIQTLQAQITELKQQLLDERKRSASLERDNRNYKEMLERILGTSDLNSLPADKKVTISELLQKIGEMQKEIEELQRKVRVAGRAYDNAQKDAQALRDKMSGGKKGGSGYTKCIGASKFLFEIKLLNGGNLEVTPAWDQDVAREVELVDGVKELVRKRSVSIEEFQHATMKILQWSMKQDPECRFHVQTVTETKDLDLYRKQMRAIDRVFYPTR